MDLILTFLGFLTLVGNLVGDYRAVCPKQPVRAEERDDVLLQYHLVPPLDLLKYTVVIWRINPGPYKAVLSYPPGEDSADQQEDQYRSRTDLSRAELIRGTVSLKISSVGLSDSGHYKFIINKLTVWVRCIIELTVERKSQHETTSAPPDDPAKPNTKCGENRSHVIPIVLGSIFLFGVLVLVLVLVLMKRINIFKQCLNKDGCEKKEDAEC